MTVHRSARSFNLALDKWATSSETRTREVSHAFMRTMANEIITGGSFGPGTPIDTGNARGSWVFGVGKAPADAGNTASAGVQGAIGTAPLGQTWVLANHVRYIRALEYGHSKQAPQGMVRVVVRKSRLILDLVSKMVRAIRRDQGIRV
jgi:hypothetical protein